MTILYVQFEAYLLLILGIGYNDVHYLVGLAGMVVGALTIFIVKNYITIEGEYFYELLPGYILAFVAIVIVSKLTRKPSESVLKIFDETQEIVRTQ